MCSALAWRMRDEGRWTVCEICEADKVVGCIIFAVIPWPERNALEVVALATDGERRRTREINEMCNRIADASDCRAIIYTSSRPLDRLYGDFEKLSTTWIRRRP